MAFVFVDSFQFLPSSLQTLTENLKKENYNFPIYKSWFNEQEYCDSLYDLLLQKGEYMYEFMDNFDKFTHTKLPPHEAFYSQLTDSNISQEQYEHAQNVFELAKWPTL